MPPSSRPIRLHQALVLLALGWPAAAGAQLRLTPLPHTVSRWTVADGLPGNVVRDVAQGADGHLWLVASGVLVRFDGRRFDQVVPATDRNTEGASTAYPLQVERGGTDTLWVVLSSGRLLARTRGTWRVFRELTNRTGTALVRELHAAPGQEPVIRTVTPIPALWRGGRELSTPQPIRSDDVYRDDLVGLDSVGTPWVILPDGTEASPAGNPMAGQTGARLPIATGYFVQRGDGHGILGVRRAAGRLTILDPSGAVHMTVADAPGRTPRLLTRDGRLIATTRDGLEILREDGTPPERIPFGARTGGPKGVRVFTVLEDQDGGLWVGTDVLGLLLLRPSSASEFIPPTAEPNQRQVSALSPAADGSIIALTNTSAYRIRQNRITPLLFAREARDRELSAALEDSRGTLWIALQSAPTVATVRVQDREGRRRHFDRPTQPVKFLEDTRRGEMLWLEADFLCRVPVVAPPESRTAPRCTPLGSWGAHDLLLTRDGTLWIAGEAGVRAETSTGTRVYSDRTGYPLGLARALYEDADGILWIGTYRGGLARLARTATGRDSLTRLTVREGLAEDVVSTIREDARGVLWMGGNRSIHAVARADVDAWRSGLLPRVPSLRVDHRDGLSNVEGSGWSAARDGDSYLWFPTFGGAVRLDPDAQLPRRDRAARALIDAVQGGDRVFAVGDTLRLPLGLRRLSIDAGLVRPGSPEAVQLEYRVDGQTEQWIPAEEPHRILLSGLQPGRWRLDVRNAAPFMPTGELAAGTMSSVVLVVPPTFRESVGFRLLLAAGVVLLLGLGIWLRTRWLARLTSRLELEVMQQTARVREERDRTATALDEATRMGSQLRELLTSKSRVFASLSHELRTPMSLIVGPLHELERSAEGQFPPGARGHLGAISTAVRRLQRLTTQFLDLADAQSGSLRVQLQKTNVVEFVRQCVEQLHPLAAPKQVRLTLQHPAGGVIEGEIDPDQLDKVVTNLVTNAIRHAPAGSEVRVRVDREPDDDAPAWTLTVRDEGPGVPPPLRERIFDPFFQAPGATEGMGLGLALSRDVVVLHKGQIRVLEDGPGATFQVRLPLEARRRERKVVVEPAAPEVAEGAADPAAAAVAGPSRAPAAPTGRTRVLVVEDDPGLCRFLAEQLGDTREVRAAMRGEEALRLLRDWPAEAVVSDVVMPGIDGFALCRILKADPMTRNIPIVLLTARGAREDQLTGLGAGADDYLVKPFDPAQLRMKVDNLIRLRSSIEDRFRRALPAWSAILLRAGAEGLDRPSEQFLERLYRELTERIPDQGFDVEQLARALNLSRASLYRRVKELLDTTPLDLLLHMRLEQAALLLRTETETIARIAHRSGFKWAPTFTVRFTAHFGLTPSAYRALHPTKGTAGR